MIVLNLICSREHRFEGWFASNAAFDQQARDGSLVCPVCGDAAITRLPSSPHVRRKSAAGGGDRGVATTGVPTVEAQLQELVKRCEDVGERFPEEARRIHYGEAPERPLLGVATVGETRQLREEGIAVVVLDFKPGGRLH